MRNDKCEVKALSCFKWKDLFSFRKYSDLLGDFSAYIWYVFLELHFIVYCNSKHFGIFSNRNSRVFAIELRHGLCLSVTMP